MYVVGATVYGGFFVSVSLSVRSAESAQTFVPQAALRFPVDLHRVR